MVCIGPYLKERNFVAVANVEADALENCIYLVRDDSTAVLSGADHVVEQRGNIMTFVDVFAHAYTSYQIYHTN